MSKAVEGLDYLHCGSSLVTRQDLAVCLGLEQANQMAADGHVQTTIVRRTAWHSMSKSLGGFAYLANGFRDDGKKFRMGYADKDE